MHVQRLSVLLLAYGLCVGSVSSSEAGFYENDAVSSQITVGRDITRKAGFNQDRFEVDQNSVDTARSKHRTISNSRCSKVLISQSRSRPNHDIFDVRKSTFSIKDCELGR